jgi:hypothetical protein
VNGMKNLKGKEMPKCFNPCLPFRDFCNAMSENEKCKKCMKKNGLVDYIE